MQNVIGNSVLDQYFDERTMSLHIKANTPAVRKKWAPGGREALLAEEKFPKKDLENLIQKIFDELKTRDDAFLEIDRKLSKVLQVGPYRIVITEAPLADELEMTVVKPVKRLTFSDYDLPEDLVEVLRDKAKGILISGAPGSGKTTFAQGLVDFYHDQNRVIKTIESPRDLMVDDSITQYSFTYGGHDEVRDILLLSRPDYTVYDEVRNKNDFELYKDLRLTGIGLIGVIHATRPVDSIQRFLGSIEMGIIPQVLDTVIFIEKGKISEVLHLELTVKVPEGMFSDDLARPVIQITSFLTKQVVYEIYTFGEQIVVMPIGESTAVPQKSSVNEYARRGIEDELRQNLPCDFLLGFAGQNAINLYIPASDKPRVIGKAGSAITQTEQKMGLSIHVKSFDDLPLLNAKAKAEFEKNYLKIQLDEVFAGQRMTMLVGNEIFQARADEQATIIIKKKEIFKPIQKQGFVFVDTSKL